MKTVSLLYRSLKISFLLLFVAAFCWSATSAAFASQPKGISTFDYDADGKADFSVWRPATGGWQVRSSASNTVTMTTFGDGAAGDIIVPADYDADGITDYAFFNGGNQVWSIFQSSDGKISYTFGQAGDKPVAADYDGDRKADPAVWRPSNGTWYIRQSSDDTIVSYQWGQTGDIPVVGNFDGDDGADYGVFRNGTWYLIQSSNGYAAVSWGLPGDVPVPADYDGDGITDPAVYRPSNNTWYALNSGSTGYQYKTWGNYGDQPVPADYDGDGKADFTVWRPATGTWYVVNSTNGTYSYSSLGAAGNAPTPAAYLKQIAGIATPSELNLARVSPKNATGGTNLYSRNFSWGTGLAGLPGRAGLDAGLSLSYNSLIWTKVTTAAQGATMVFDADNSNITPGFRFGFPTIEPAFLDSRTGQFSFLMVTTGGARVEFRQTAASGLYETADSSYTQLKIKDANHPNAPYEDLKLTVTTTDGTQMSYSWISGAFRCTQVKDTNGNFISVGYLANTGLLDTVTDTLGRILKVNYDADLYPTTITQQWQSGTHTYATFAYTIIPVTPNFGTTLNVAGPTGGAGLRVLEKVTFANNGGSNLGAVAFDYNSYAQVWRVRSLAADNHELNHTAVKLAINPSDGAFDTTTVQSDCPRFSQTRNYAENFNDGAEVIVNNSITESYGYSVPGATGTATMIEVSMPLHPNGAFSRTVVGASGWMEGLPIVTEDFSTDGAANPTRMRWTSAVWTQDNTLASYPINPRTIESKVGDTTNIKKATTKYYTQDGLPAVALYGLVKETEIYAADQITVLKKAVVEYNQDTAYLSRRIIGLPAKSEIYGADENNVLGLMSKVTYLYDEGNFSDAALAQNIAPVQHDNTAYGASFVTGRANLTSTTRWNADYPTNSSLAVTSSVKYNTAGASVASIDPLGKTVKISYTDSFDGTFVPTGATYAYPTTLTTPGVTTNSEVSSLVKYRFDIGANVRAQSPAPAGQTTGKITTRIFDLNGRLEKESIWKNNLEYAYTRYDYQPNQIESRVYSTVVDTDNNGVGNTGDEVLSEVLTDGAGRTIKSRTPLTWNSSGAPATYSGQRIEYDILGRVKRQSVPTEVDSNWQIPLGSEDYRGLETNSSNQLWLWTSQSYDWKGRTLVTTNTDGTTTKQTYQGCGCAGGEIVTIEGEQLAAGRRTQKIYADILGRTMKTEVMEWNGTTRYTTTVNKFNGRDQVTRVLQYAGEEGSSTPREVTTIYDGHGRQKRQHYPIEDPGADTVWEYNADDSVATKTDPRGVVTSYLYNSRGMVENVSYAVPANNPAATERKYVFAAPSVTYSYDAVGNRTQMSEGAGGTGTTYYAYDELSRLVSETKDFPDLTSNYTVAYNYNLAGGLKSYTDPFTSTVTYTNDKAGRLQKVGGTRYGTATTGNYNGDLTNNYVDNIQYRAWGGIKGLNYKTDGDAAVSMSYDTRLRVTGYAVQSSPGGTLKQSSFSYYSDSRPAAMTDAVNAKFSRTFTYDFAGRLTANTISNGGLQTYDMPYQQIITYDAFSQMTQRWTQHWGTPHQFTAAFSDDGRKTNEAIPSVYDAAGNLLYSAASGTGNSQATAFDAANRPFKSTTGYRERRGLSYWYYENETEQIYDGDGTPLKVVEKRRKTSPAPTGDFVLETKYQIWSSVLKNTISEIRSDGTKAMTKVFAGGAVVATQHGGPAGESVIWTHADPVSGSSTSVDKSGMGAGRTEYEPLGQEVQSYEPPEEEMPQNQIALEYSASSPEWLCKNTSQKYWDMPTACQRALNESTGDLRTLLSAKTEHNPKKLSLVDSPIPRFSSPTGRSSEMVLALSLRATDKKPPNQDDGEVEDEGGRIRIETWVMEIPGYVDPSVSQDPESLHKAPKAKYPNPKKELKPRVDNALKYESCEEKLNALLSSLKSDEKIGSVANRFYEGLNGSELFLTDDKLEFLKSKNSVPSIFGKKTDGRKNAPAAATEGRNSIVMNRIEFGDNYETLSFIHELIHAAGGGSHENIATAIVKLEKIVSPLDNKSLSKDQRDLVATNLINSYINDHCNIGARGVRKLEDFRKGAGTK